jgi:hypothetical protein
VVTLGKFESIDTEINMSPSFVVLDLALVVALDNHSPTVMNVDFLRLSGIVPQDWELARPLVMSQQGSQIVFANGVSMMGQADRVVFLAPMLEGGERADQVALLAQKYVQALSQGDYQAVGVNLRGYASSSDPNWVGQYFGQALLRPGAWQQIGTETVRPSLTLNYSLGANLGQLNLTITPAQIQQADQPALDTIFFAANYNQTLQGVSSERVLQLQGVLATWQQYHQHFVELVQTQFLAVAGDNYDPLLRDAALSGVA